MIKERFHKLTEVLDALTQTSEEDRTAIWDYLPDEERRLANVWTGEVTEALADVLVDLLVIHGVLSGGEKVRFPGPFPVGESQVDEYLESNQVAEVAMGEVLHQQDLDAFRCADPSCTEDHKLYLQLHCPQAGYRVAYDRPAKQLVFYCMACGILIQRIAVGAATTQ